MTQEVTKLLPSELGRISFTCSSCNRTIEAKIASDSKPIFDGNRCSLCDKPIVSDDGDENHGVLVTSMRTVMDDFNRAVRILSQIESVAGIQITISEK